MEDAARLDSYANGEGYDWIFAEGPASLVRDYNVRSQSSYVGIGRDGAILSRRGYGADGASFWRGVLDTLRSS
ncbi:MAG: hypothetical protein F4Z88_06320 [Chloroflexi bacterium]|nr:hypothetical protein [Chloroflexota bacterium]